MRIGWESTAYFVSEDEGALLVCATAQSWTPIDSEVGVQIVSRNETALGEYSYVFKPKILCNCKLSHFLTENEDFGGVSTRLFFNAPSACIQIDIIDDPFPELSETFTIQIIAPRPVSSQFGEVIFATSTDLATITINDNDCELPGKQVH